jgi:hypothetical protein
MAGGWAIDAFTGTPRAHGDLDIGIPRMEAPVLGSSLRSSALELLTSRP